MKQKEVFIHIGAPKTATTLIQHALNKNKKSLQTLGCDVLLPGQIRGCDFYKYIFANHTGKNTTVSLDEAKNDFAMKLNQCQNNKVIVSEEGFTQHLMPSDLTNRGFAGVRQSLESIKAIAPNISGIVLSIRNQVKLIESIYKHKIKWKFCSLSLEEFLTKHVDTFNLSWAKVIQTIEEVFPNKVKVVPFELLHLSESHFINCFYQSVQIESKEILMPSSNQILNESLADNHAEFMRLINKLIKNLDSFNISTRPIVKIQLIKELLENEPKRNLPEFKIPLKQANQIRSYYNKENIQIIKRYCSRDNYEFLKSYY